MRGYVIRLSEFLYVSLYKVNGKASPQHRQGLSPRTAGYSAGAVAGGAGLCAISFTPSKSGQVYVQPPGHFVQSVERQKDQRRDNQRL